MCRRSRYEASMRGALLALVALAFSGCAPGDPSAGSPSGGNSAPNCSTGTLVVLADPSPGSRVAPKTRAIEIASNALISKAGIVLAVGIFGKTANEIRPLYGPIATPSPSPTPPPADSDSRARSASPYVASPQEFPSPLYYEARGFSLQPKEIYSVRIAALHSSCNVTMIKGALFRTKP
jgi:hypothetical protein